MATEALRAEHDAVLSTLSTRTSTKHFAHGAVSLFASVVLVGTSGKLWWDFSIDNPEWSALAGVLGCAVLSYSLARFMLGARAYNREALQVVRLLGLRKELGFDAPAALFRPS